MPKKQLYIIAHHHKFGVSTYVVRCNHFPIEEEVVDACIIDYEPDRGEYIDIDPYDGKVVEIGEKNSR